MSKLQKENPKPNKTWKYGIFSLQAHTYNNCKTQYGEYYDKNREHKFTFLKLQEPSRM